MTKFFSFVQRHLLRLVAAAALAGLSCQLAVFNAGGWHDRGLDLLAVLAVITEALAFVMAVCVEGAGRWYKAVICALILVGCEIFNAAGTHEAWNASQAPHFVTEQRAAQAALDARLAALRQTIADAQTRIDRVPAPVPTDVSRRQAEARQTWETLTAGDRETKARAQAALDASPVVAAAPDPIFADWMVWAFLGFLGFAKSLGLFGIGMSVAKTQSRAPVAEVVEFDASLAGRRLVAMRRDRQRSA